MEMTYQTERRNGLWTVLVATLITIRGLATAFVAAHEIGLDPLKWSALMPVHLPVLAIGVLHVVSGVYLGRGPGRLAVWSLLATLVASIVWHAFAPRELVEESRGGLLLILGLLTARWHMRREGDARQ